MAIVEDLDFHPAVGRGLNHGRADADAVVSGRRQLELEAEDEIGVLPGISITLVRAAPLGDPLEIQVRGYNLTLRKSEAEHVLVEPADDQ